MQGLRVLRIFGYFGTVILTRERQKDENFALGELKERFSLHTLNLRLTDLLSILH